MTFLGTRLPGRVAVKIRTKFFIVMASAQLALLGLALGLWWFILRPEAESADRRAMEQAMTRLADKITAAQERLIDLCQGYAAWDDTVTFIADRNETYVATNLSAETLTQAGVELFAVWDPAGALVAGRAREPATGKLSELGRAAAEVIFAEAKLEKISTDERRSGIAKTDGRLIIYGAMPVLRSDYTGPIAGTLAVGWRMDELITRAWSKKENYSVELLKPEQAPQAEIALSDGQVFGYLSLRDARGEVLRWVRLVMPAEITARYRHDVRIVVLWLLVGGVTLNFLTLWLLQRYVFSRVSRLTQGVETLHASEGNQLKLEPFGGEDEVAKLAVAINAMAAQLGQATTRAESADRAKSDFLAMMSHELRTPLNAMHGFATLLADTRLDPKQSELALSLRQGSEALHTLLGEIIDYAQLSTGKLTLQRERVDYREILNEVIALYRPRMLDKGLALRVHVMPMLPDAIFGDARRFRQIVIHLISNAVKYTQCGGIYIVIDAFCEEAAINFRVQVADTGVGMSAGTQEKLFKPFEQADTSATREFGGAGLGLAACRQIAQAMGGSISASSEEGQGACFTLLLPFEGMAGAEAPRADAHGWVAGLPETEWAQRFPLSVLVVEDNAVNRKVIGGMLHRFGYEAAFAENGSVGLESMRAHSFDLVLMDLHMPVMDGIASTRARRQQEERERLPRLRIVALTANSVDGVRETCIAAGMDGYLSKPVRLESVREVLLEQISIRHHPQPAPAA